MYPSLVGFSDDDRGTDSLAKYYAAVITAVLRETAVNSRQQTPQNASRNNNHNNKIYAAVVYIAKHTHRERERTINNNNSE